MDVHDSRRLTGPNLLWDRPGAVVEVSVSEPDAAHAITTWRSHAQQVLAAIGWHDSELCTRRYVGGASLAFSAPIDCLYAACDVSECVAERTAAELDGREPGDLEGQIAPLRTKIAQERDPRVLALHDTARERAVSFLPDDELITVGSGRGGRSFPVDDLPSPDAIDWDEIADVPTVLVTGTNGKSTTVRLLASIIEHAGRTPGVSSTDWVRVGSDTLDSGDYSGPEGARRVLRDRRTEVAVLETARGGLVRRGLAVPRASAAVVLNVDADHLGEGGVDDVDTLARVKLLVSRAVPNGPLILNADDDVLHRIGRSRILDQPDGLPARPLPPIAWFSLDAEHTIVRAAIANGAPTATLYDGDGLTVQERGEFVPIVRASEIPITFGGTARFNIRNALAACAASRAIGLRAAVIRAGLTAFESSPESNPGRGNLFDLGGVRVFADFAHNAHGLRALFEMANAIPAKRRLVLLGQAGDRNDAAIRDMCRVTWDARPDRIVIKKMTKYLRGRTEGEMVELIDRELRAAGTPPERINHCDSEIAAVHAALGWAQPGDLLLMLLHESRAPALELFAKLRANGWRPGTELPA